MNDIKTYKDLIVWQKAMTMVTQIYVNTKLFPKEEIYGLTSQIRRAAVSIPSNIAEGYGRRARQEYIRFLNIAMGSLYELQTQIEIAVNLDYLEREVFTNIYNASREVERLLNGLIMSLQGKNRD